MAPQSGLVEVLRLGQGLEDVCLVPGPCVDWSVFCFWAEHPGTVSTLLFTGRVVDAIAKVPCSAARANCSARSALAPLPHSLPRGTAHTFRTPALPPPALARCFPRPLAESALGTARAASSAREGGSTPSRAAALGAARENQVIGRFP